MRPQTNAEIAAALKTQAAYATDSEAKWLMEEAAKRIDAAEDTKVVAGIVERAADLAQEIAEGAAGSQPAEEQKASPPAKPHRLPRKKPAEGEG